MYIPSFNKIEDIQEAIRFMQRYSFATVVTVKDCLPVATHLPFLVKHKNDKVIISSHFAKANPQSADIIDSTTLVIFSEPHAYISPKNYEKEQNVPTWNYLAVHAYGKCTILEGDDKAMLLKEMIQNYEPGYLKQWDGLPDEYKQRMMKGIVAFEMVVDDLQAKAKLSQNRTETERENIINNLSHAESTAEREIAEYMSALKKSGND